MSNINTIIYNYDELDESFFQDIRKSISKRYDNTKDFISDGIDNIEERAKSFYHGLIKFASSSQKSIEQLEKKIRFSRY